MYRDTMETDYLLAAAKPCPLFLGLRTVVYNAPNLTASKNWFSKALDQDPYFDEPYYVGYNIGGYELGLDPDQTGSGHGTVYWGVSDIELAVERLITAGAEIVDGIREVGGGIRLATVREPQGNILGVIENPHS
jgi:predicted enzyme related to lactoylglutathione lyase